MAAMTRAFLTILLLLPAAFSVQAACFEEAGRRYGIPPSLLKAISAVESNSNPAARHRNRDGSEDLGHMQINSRWLRKLRSYGIGRDQLFDACTSTYIGAWILAQNIRRLGYGWEAVGAYNAVSPDNARPMPARSPRGSSHGAREPGRRSAPHDLDTGRVRDRAPGAAQGDSRSKSQTHGGRQDRLDRTPV